MPNASIHITLAPKAQLDLEVTEPPQSAVDSPIYTISGQANVQNLQVGVGSFYATAFVDTPSDFTILCWINDDGANQFSGTLSQTGCTVVIDVDGTDLTVPDGAWTMTYS